MNGRLSTGLGEALLSRGVVLSFEESEKLGVELWQNAIVWCGSDAVSNLILLR